MTSMEPFGLLAQFGDYAAANRHILLSGSFSGGKIRSSN